MCENLENIFKSMDELIGVQKNEHVKRIRKKESKTNPCNMKFESERIRGVKENRDKLSGKSRFNDV